MSIDYIQRFWDALAYETERLLGQYGTSLLFGRLYRLSPEETTILRARIRLPTLECEETHDLQTVHPACQLTRASEALTIHFHNLSSSLIGEGLTSKLLYAAMVTANRGFEHSFGSKTDD